MMAPPTADDISLFEDYYYEQKDLIDDRISEILDDHEDLVSKRKILAHTTTGGKRVRPVLTMLVADVYDVPRDKALNHAAIVELIHNASLVVDDAYDQDDTRRDRSTLWSALDKLTFTKRGKKLRTGMSIMTQTGLLGLALELADDPDVMDAMAYGTRHLVDGFFLEGRNVTWGVLGGGYDRYIEINRAKTGGLFAMAAWMPATYTDRPDEEIQAARKWGEETGILYQVADDYVDDDLPSFVDDPEAELEKWYEQVISHVSEMPYSDERAQMRFAPAYMVDRMLAQEGKRDELTVSFLPSDP